MATLTDEDEGKVLVDVEGEQLGVVTEVETGVAYVDPEPGLSEAIKAAFGHADRDEDDLAVEADLVETVTEEEVRLRGDVS